MFLFAQQPEWPSTSILMNAGAIVERNSMDHWIYCIRAWFHRQGL